VNRCDAPSLVGVVELLRYRAQCTEGSLFDAVSLCGFLFVYEISRKRLNRWFAPNSQGRRVWSLALTSLKVKVKGQRARSPGTKNGLFGPFGGLRFMFGKTCLASNSLILSVVRDLIAVFFAQGHVGSFTDHFSGPARAIGQICVSVCVTLQ